MKYITLHYPVSYRAQNVQYSSLVEIESHISLGCTVEPLCHVLPVDYIPNGLDIVGANILVLEVVGMLK